MKILTNIVESNKSPNFKKGLTPYEVKAVKGMGFYEYESIANKLKQNYGLEAYFRGDNTVLGVLTKLHKS